MKKQEKSIKRIYIALAILVFLIIQVIVMGLSRGQKIIEINLHIKDKEAKIPEQTVIVNALDGGKAGYYYIIPEIVSDKYLKESYIGDMVKTPGERIYLSEEELSSKESTINVEYNKKEAADGSNIYYSIKDIYIGDINIRISSYFPKEIELNVVNKENEEIRTLANKQIETDGFLNIENIFKLESNIRDLKEEANIQIKGLDSSKIYKIYNIFKKTEYKDYTDDVEIKDALGNNINKFNIKKIESTYSEKEGISFKTNFKDLEYFAIASKANILSYKKMGLKAMSLPSTFNVADFTDTWDGSTASSFFGEGTEAFPYLISKASELAYLRDRVNAGINYEGQYFQLVNNIDLAGKSWTPIGSYNYPFRGNFDGAGKNIKNAIITTQSSYSQNEVLSYGFFGSIGGGNQRQEIKNLELENIRVKSYISGSTTTSTYDNIFGINIGVLTGTMYKNSTISNVNVLDFEIEDNSNFEIRTYRMQYFVGGIVGEIIYMPKTRRTANTYEEHKLIASAATGNISLYTDTRNMTSTAKYHTGGIVGSITTQMFWPENCIYTGDIRSNGLIGPIFGGAMRTIGGTSYREFDDIWQGLDCGNLYNTNKYFNYRANGTSFTSTENSSSSNSRIGTSYWYISYVQGVNKGEHTNLNQALASLNSNPESANVKWEKKSSKLRLRPRIYSKIEENPQYTYSNQIYDDYSILSDGTANTYTYSWYKEEIIDENTNSVFVLTEPNFDKDLNIRALVKDASGYYARYDFQIPKIYVEIEFIPSPQTNSVKANINGPGMFFTSIEDYSFKWYKEDISGMDLDLIEGNTSNILGNLETKYDYKIIATNNKIAELSIEDTYYYAKRTVIYVDGNRGSGYNDGLAPERAVQTFSQAYSKLPSTNSVDENVIVLMGQYQRNDLFSGENSITYMKNATITGTYKKEEYNGYMFFTGYQTYKYLNGNTNFMYITFDGREYTSSWWGGGSWSQTQLYWYLQGYSLTMGEGVRMVNYARSNVNQGLIQGNAPAFHIFAAWHKYDYARLPRTNSKILIKSGTYGRIVLGGSPGTNDVQNLQNYTSRNFTGSSETDSFNVEATIDIQNSTTTSEFPYDINLFVGGSASGNMYANIVENIKSGKIGRVLRSINRRLINKTIQLELPSKHIYWNYKNKYFRW